MCIVTRGSKTDAADPDNELSRSLNLIPYSTVTLQRAQRRRPVLFTPAALAATIIQKILNMGGAMDFDICKPGPCDGGRMGAGGGALRDCVMSRLRGRKPPQVKTFLFLRH